MTTYTDQSQLRAVMVTACTVLLAAIIRNAPPNFQMRTGNPTGSTPVNSRPLFAVRPVFRVISQSEHYETVLLTP
jgi:hypothetical protein